MNEAVIRCEGLTRHFGEFVAVDHVSFEVRKGEIVGYLGPNGSGKTTTIRMLLGLLRPSEGRATVLDHDAFTDSEAVRPRTGYMSQKFALYDDLTVMENLVFYAGVYGIRDRAQIRETIALVDLAGHENAMTGSLSAGWRQRLALGIALVHRPELLFLDEPTSGVDPTARRAFWDLIYKLADEGVTALVTTHYMDEAEYCGRVGIMREGRLLALATPGELKAQLVSGDVWEIFAEPLEQALRALREMPRISRASLAGDHIRAIVERGYTRKDVLASLTGHGVGVSALTIGEATLEDVFLSLST